MRKSIFILFALVLILLPKYALAQEFLQVQGCLDLVNKALKIEIKPEAGNLQLSAKLNDNSDFALDMKLEHVKIGTVDVLGDVHSFGHVYFDKDKIIKGVKFDLSTANLLVNHVPVEDVFVSCEMNNQVLKINSLEGANIFLSGYLELRRPYDINLLARLKPFSLADFATVFENKNPNIMGDLEGIVKLGGILRFPEIQANLMVYNGTIENVPFKEAVINFTGSYPVVRFTDSKILGEQDDLLDLKGFLDLSKLDNLESPFHNFKLNPTGNKVRIADWNLMKDTISKNEYKFKKDINETFSVGFDSYVKDETKYKDENEDTFKLEYKMDSDRYLNMKLKENESILGVENRVEF